MESSAVPDHVRRLLPKDDPLFLPRNAQPRQLALLDLGGALPHPEPQRDKAPALGGPGEGKKEGVPRITVRFVGHRVKPLDPDNFAGSVKDLLDGLRHAGLITGDEPWRIRLETEQEKVGKYADEKTIIELIYPPNPCTTPTP